MKYQKNLREMKVSWEDIDQMLLESSNHPLGGKMKRITTLKSAKMKH